MYKFFSEILEKDHDHSKWVMLIINKVKDRPAQVRYQRIVALAKAFNVIVITGHVLPKALNDIVKEVHVVSQGWHTWKTAVCVAKKLTTERKDFYIHTQYSPNGLVAGYFCKRLVGSKWLYDLWDHPSLGWMGLKGYSRWMRQALWLGILRQLIVKADAWVIAMHPGILTHLPAPSVACQLIYTKPGYLKSKCHEKKKQQNLNSAKRKIKVVYVGPIVPERGLNDIIGWMVSNNGPAVDMHLVGPHDNKKLSINLLSEMERVCFKNESMSLKIWGELPHNKVMELLCDADIGLCPIDTQVLNYRFAYPVKVMEYMSLGMIVVATESHGTRALISNEENGFLGKVIEGGFSSALKRALELCQDPGLSGKMSEEARQYVLDYEWKYINDQLVKKIRIALEI